MQHRCAFMAGLISFSANLAFSAKTGIITIEGQEGRPVDKPARTEEGGTQYGRKRDRKSRTQPEQILAGEVLGQRRLIFGNVSEAERSGDHGAQD